MDLIGTLGLDQVAADPNDIPDGKYDGEVFKSEIVLVEKKDKANTINHVTTFRVTDGTFKGAQRQKWDKLGEDPRDANGSFPSKVEEVASYTPTMSDAQKTWYKKSWVDLGIPEAQVGQAKPEDLVGKPVTFGVKTKDGYKNINFVELRAEAGTTPAGPVSVNAGSPAAAQGNTVVSPF